MSWLRIDDGFTEHRKIVPLSDAAFRLHVEALCYASRQQTDGFIADVILLRWHTDDDTRSLGKIVDEELVRRGLWEPVDGGWMVHDFLEYNPSRDERHQRADQRKRAGKARAKAASREGGKFVRESHQHVAGASHQRPAGDVHQRGGWGGESSSGSSSGSESTEVVAPALALVATAAPPPSMFETFWLAYPRHEGKAAARKAWDRLRPNDVLATRIMGALAWQVELPRWREDGGQFVPHAATYLNQRRWEDERPKLDPLAGRSPREKRTAEALARWVQRGRDAATP